MKKLNKLEELKIKEVALLQKIAEDNRQRFIPITYNGETINVLYAGMYFHKSVLYKAASGKYVLIKASLSYEDKQKEMHLLFKDKKLHYFNGEEKVKIEDKIKEQQKKENRKRAKEVLFSVIDNYIERFGQKELKGDIEEITNTISAM